MKRNDFMRELEFLLSDIADSEREEAIQFYNDYFEDAGEDNEADVIKELESPEKVAAIIKSGLSESNIESDTGEYTESGYKDTRFQEANKVPQTRVTGYRQNRNNNDYNYGSNDKETGYQYKDHSGNDYSANRSNSGDYTGNGTNGAYTAGKNKNPISVLLIILLCFLAIPVGLPVIGTIFGLVLGVFGTIFGLSIAAFAIAVVMIIIGIVFIGLGIGNLFSFPAMGILLCGVGMLMLAFGILSGIFLIGITGRFVPWFIRTIVNLFNRIFHRGRKEQ